MRVFVSHGNERETFDVPNDSTVRHIIEKVRETFHIGSDEGPAGMELEDQKVLAIAYAGALLSDHWSLSDLGVPNGATLKAVLKTVVKPSLYVYCAFNEETVPIVNKINVQQTNVGIVRGMVSRQTGLPVTVFRLTTQSGIEMYDNNTLWDYGVNLTDTLRLDVWDGWKEFLNLCVMGFTRHVMAHLPHDDVMARFHMKVAMYLAAHFGHVDLAVTLLKQGIRADESIGEHPMRQWCKYQVLHIDAEKAPVHEAAEAGSLSVLRSFVHSNVCNVLAKDGNDLTPLNLALRKKQKPCASFLLTKQWSKVSYTKKNSVNLSIYVKMKRWSERARNKVLVIYGQWKSSIKNPKKHIQIGALLGQGVQLDGFSKSKMTTKPEGETLMEMMEEEERRHRMYSNPIPPPVQPDVYFRSVKMMQDNLNLPRLHKFSKIMQKVGAGAEQEQKDSSTEDKSSEHDTTDSDSTSGVFDTRQQAFRPRSNSHSGVRLPPITEKKKGISASQQNLSTLNLDDPEFRQGKRTVNNAKPGDNNKQKDKEEDEKISKPAPFKQSISTQSLGDGLKVSKKAKAEEDEDTGPRKKKERNVRSATLLAKAKTEGGSIPLPMVSTNGVPRPFIRAKNEDLTKVLTGKYKI